MGESGVKGREYPGQQHRSPAAVDAQTHLAPQPGIVLPQPGVQLLFQGLHLQKGSPEHLAGRGQLQAGPALKQAHPNPLFQPADMVAQALLGHKSTAGRAGKAHLLADQQKHLVAGIHGAASSSEKGMRRLFPFLFFFFTKELCLLYTKEKTFTSTPKACQKAEIGKL